MAMNRTWANSFRCQRGRKQRVPKSRNESAAVGLNPGSVALEFSGMRKSSWTASIVPRGDDQDVYLVTSADSVGFGARQMSRLPTLRPS
jgi:hypothetical protein